MNKKWAGGENHLLCQYVKERFSAQAEAAGGDEGGCVRVCLSDACKGKAKKSVLQIRTLTQR